MDYWWGLPSLPRCEKRSSNESWTNEFNRPSGGVSFRKAARPVPQVMRLDAVEALELHHLKADVVTYLGRTAVRIANTGVLDSGYGEGLAIVRGVSLLDGTIEGTLSGDTLANAPPQFRGFVRIAFRVRDRSHFECL